MTIVTDSGTISANPFLQRLVDYLHEHAELQSAFQFADEVDLPRETKGLTISLHFIELSKEPLQSQAMENPKLQRLKNFLKRKKNETNKK